MRFAILLVLMSSCSLIFQPEQFAYKRAERKWSAIEKIIKKYPALADSFKIVTRDTVRTTAFQDSIVFQWVLDSVKFDSMVMAYKATITSQGNGIETHKPPGLGKLRKAISTMGCPVVSVDTTYRIQLFNSKDTVDIPVSLYLQYSDGKLTAKISGTAGQLPEQNTAKSLTFNAPQEIFYNNRWFWYFCVLAFIFVLFLIIRLRR